MSSASSNDILSQLFQQIETENSELSNLLLEYQDENNSTSQNLSSMLLNIEDIFPIDSIDSLAIFNLLTNSYNQQHIGSPGDSGKESSREKLKKNLIKLLIKSCRLFDVATQKTDTRMAYWRYANPIVALTKQRNLKDLSKINNLDAAVQTCDIVTNVNNFEEESTLNETNESEKNLKTIIEANKKTNAGDNNFQSSEIYPKTQSKKSLLTRSIIELVNESLCDKKVKLIK